MRALPVLFIAATALGAAFAGAPVDRSQASAKGGQASAKEGASALAQEDGGRARAWNLGTAAQGAVDLSWERSPDGLWYLRPTEGAPRPLAVVLEVAADDPGWRAAPPEVGVLTVDTRGRERRSIGALSSTWSALPVGTALEGESEDGSQAPVPEADTTPRAFAAYAGESPPAPIAVGALLPRPSGPVPVAAAVLRVEDVLHALNAAPLPELPPAPGDPLPGATAEELERFEAGRREFDAHMSERDGLGPAFNDHSCFICHLGPASGGFSERRVLHFARSDRGGLPIPELGGPVLQSQGIHPSAVELLPEESDVQSVRITPHLFGSGLVELIPDELLLAGAADQPEGVRGRAHLVPALEDERIRVGRFGWKSQMATLLTFTADASLVELGQTNRLLPFESPPGGDPRVVERFDRVADPELTPGPDGRDRLDRLVDFQGLLAPPPQTPAEGHAGEALFGELGCATCHTPRMSFRTERGDVSIAPYSDFLLHDMGGEGDAIRTGDAAPQEMRTAPLWGLTGRRFLWHDGELAHVPFPELIVRAIARHRGQGDASRQAFEDLGAAQRELLIDFLRSLGRSPHDLNADGKVDGSDGQWLAAELGSAPAEGSDSGAAASGAHSAVQTWTWRELLDIDGDGSLSPGEWLAFAAEMERAPARQRQLASPLR